MITNYKEMNPHIYSSVYIAPGAAVIGDVTLAKDCSVWFNVTIRGDMASITIGEGTNIQDNAVVHVNTDMPTIIGANVTVGHGAIIHACTVGDGCLIGMGSIILDEAIIGEESLVAAGAVVTPRKQFPAHSLIVGSPAKVVRSLTEQEIEKLRKNALHYVDMSNHYK